MSCEVTIYRSDRSLWLLPVRPLDTPVAHWSAYEFEPRPFAARDGAEFRKLRMASVPIRIYSICPVERIGEGRKARLAIWSQPKGIDAESVYWLARRGEKGLKLLDAAVTGNID